MALRPARAPGSEEAFAPVVFYQAQEASALAKTDASAIKKDADADVPAAPQEKGEAVAAAHAPIAFELKRSARRSIGIAVRAGALRVTAPHRATLAQIDTALATHAGWIVRKLGETREQASRAAAAAPCWHDGATLAYRGRPLALRLDAGISADGTAWLDAPDGDRTRPAALCLALPGHAASAQIRAAVQTFLLAEAHTHALARLAHFAPLMGVRYLDLRLSNAATRWGSASANGTIRLHWRLIQLDPALLDYVVVHELAHLRHMDHSARFWAVVEAVLPAHVALRKQLRSLALPHWG